MPLQSSFSTCLVGVLLAISCIETESLVPVKITINDASGIARIGEAVCSGIPFAQGTLQPNQPVHVRDADGDGIPTQIKVLGSWPDGSVKWLLVQFFANCAANSEAVYHLASGIGPAPELPLKIYDRRDEIILDTGPLKVEIPRNKLALFRSVQLRGATEPVRLLDNVSPMQFVLADGSAHTSSGVKPETVIVEETGPLRATIRQVGWLRDAADNRSYKLDTRLRFYAGETYVKAEQTFICLGQPELHEVKEIFIDLKPDLGANQQFELPAGTGTIQGELTDGRGALLAADTNMICKSGPFSAPQEANKKLDGWAVLTGDRATFGLAVRDFWHLAPKSIELVAGKLKLSLWSNHQGDLLKLGRTRAKTHHILYAFGNADDQIADRVGAFQQPLIANVEPEYFCDTEVFGPLSPAGEPETIEYDRKIRSQFETLLDQRQTMPRENGMLHYGDYHHGGYGNQLTRGDLEYDTGHGSFLLYARSGQRDYYDFAIACNQHFIDIDLNHENGEQRFHGYGAGAETHEAVTTHLEWGHVFVDCAADAYYLTGDERSLEAVRMIADRVTRIAEGDDDKKIRDIFAGAERQLGWPLMVLCRAYKVTGEMRYLDAAKKIVDYIKIYARDPLAAYGEGKWWRSWMMDGCKLFMTGQLHDGLSAYYAITGDEELRHVITIGLDWLIDHMWNPEVDGFVYEFNAFNRRNRLAGITSLNLLGVDAFRFGYEMTGDRRYLSISTRAFLAQVREMTPSTDGKAFSMNARSSPHTAAYFHREGITPGELPPSPQPLRQTTLVPPLEPRDEILLEAAFEGDLQGAMPKGVTVGKVVGRIEFVSGRKPGSRAVAVSTDGYVQLPAPSEMLNGPGSVELWVRLNFEQDPDKPGQRSVLHVEGQTPLVNSLSLTTIFGNLRVRLKDDVGHLHGTAEGDVTNWKAGEWHHVVVTWDTARVRLYLDGNEQTREDEGSRFGDEVIALPAGRQTRINLGWRYGNWYCDASIDDLTIYGRALTAEEIAEHFAAG